MGGRAGVQGVWEGPLSCLAMLLVSGLVLSCPGVSSVWHAKLGDRYCVRFGLMRWHGHGAGQGRTRLQDPRALSQRLRHPSMGRRSGWLLKPNNKALARAHAQALPKPFIWLYLGTTLAPEERRGDCHVVWVN